MAKDTASQNTERQDPAGAPKRRRPRHHVIGLWTAAGLVLGAAAFSLLVILIIGQTMQAPEWVRDRIEARIEQNLGGLQISFGDVQAVINKGLRPRARLRDVVIRDPAGRVLLELGDAEASLAMRPLLRGMVQPKQITLNGAFATLRRNTDGTFDLSLGASNAPVSQAGSLPQLIERWDQILQSEALSALVSLDLKSLNLRYEDALSGRAWTVDGGQMRMERDGDQMRLSSRFALLSGRDYATSLEMNYTSKIGELAADFGISVEDVAAQDIAAQAIALKWLQVLRAPISGALRGNVEADGTLGRLSATLQIGAGVLQPTDQTRPIPFSQARTYFTYSPDRQVLAFDELSVSSDWVSGVADGTAYLGGVDQGTLTELIGQFNLSGLALNPDGMYPEPLTFNRAAADFRLELDPFRLTVGQMRVVDPSATVRLDGTLSASTDGWALAFDGKMDAITPKRLVSLWPVGVAKGPRDWIATKISGGRLSDINFALRTKPNERPNIYVDFDYADATVKVLKTMPPMTAAKGQASLIGNRFVVTATAGRMPAEQGGYLDLAGSSFIIPDITIRKAAPGIVRFVAQGPVTAIVSLLNRPPLSVLASSGLPVDLASGLVRANGTVSMPIKKGLTFDQVEFHLTGAVDRVESTVLVPGKVLSAQTMDLQADETQVVLSGRGQVEEVPFDAGWRKPIGKGAPRSSRVEGQIELSPLLIDTFEIGLPPGSVSGTGLADFSLDLNPGEPPVLTMRSDLQGVGLQIPALLWSKPAASSGLLDLAGTLGAPSRLDRLVLEAPGLSVTGTVIGREQGGLERALLSSVRVGDWMEGTVELVGRGQGAPDLRILGGTLDMRRATFGSAGGSGGTGALSVVLDRLQVSDTIALTGFRGEFKTAGVLDGPFQGLVNGGTPVNGQLVPRGARSAVRILSDDAGGTVRDAGLLKQARGGSFDLTLVPVPEPGEFDGTLRVTDVKIQDAPAIAALVNAVSIVGLLDELAGQGIQFTEVDARFRLSPSRVTLYESSAVGPSIGLSMDGEYDVPNGQLNMQGVISPVYLINQIGSLLTRKGEGMFGFNYTLKGSAQAPTVQVNPLSALTPGMLRDIFREAPPSAEDSSETPDRRLKRAPSLSDSAEGGR